MPDNMLSSRDSLRRWCTGRGVTGRSPEVRAIDLSQLQRAVAFADPSAVMVSPRVMRRVIRRDRGLRFLGGAAARQTSYVVRGDLLSGLVRGTEFGPARQTPWPEWVVLLARPEPEDLAEETPA